MSDGESQGLTPEECGGFKLCVPKTELECIPCRNSLSYKKLPVRLSGQVPIPWKFYIPNGNWDYFDWVWEGDGFNDQYRNRIVTRQPQDVNIPLGVTNGNYPDPVNYSFAGDEIIDENLPLFVPGTYAEVYGHDKEPNPWNGQVLHWREARQMCITGFSMFCSTAGTTDPETGEPTWYETLRLKLFFSYFRWISGNIYNEDPNVDPTPPVPPPLPGNGWNIRRELGQWTYPDLQYSCQWYTCGTYLPPGEYLGCVEYPLETVQNWVDPTSGEWPNKIDPYPIDLSEAF